MELFSVDAFNRFNKALSALNDGIAAHPAPVCDPIVAYGLARFQCLLRTRQRSVHTYGEELSSDLLQHLPELSALLETAASGGRP